MAKGLPTCNKINASRVILSVSLSHHSMVILGRGVERLAGYLTWLTNPV